MNGIRLKCYDTLRPPGMGLCRQLAVQHNSFLGLAKMKASDFRRFGFTVAYNATADAAGVQRSIITLE